MQKEIERLTLDTMAAATATVSAAAVGEVVATGAAGDECAVALAAALVDLQGGGGLFSRKKHHMHSLFQQIISSSSGRSGCYRRCLRRCASRRPPSGLAMGRAISYSRDCCWAGLIFSISRHDGRLNSWAEMDKWSLVTRRCKFRVAMELWSVVEG